jgi:hypothetical protein
MLKHRTNDDDDIDIDEEALERAIVLAREESPGRARQIDNMVERDWWGAARFASYCSQCNSLHLPPWQSPPCWIGLGEIEGVIARGDDGASGRFQAAVLLRRLLQARLSRYEPDPLGALERAKRP